MVNRRASILRLFWVGTGGLDHPPFEDSTPMGSWSRGSALAAIQNADHLRQLERLTIPSAQSLSV